MGYYTNYELSIENDSKLMIDDDIEAISKYLESLEVFDDIDIQGTSHAWCKWYDHTDDMCWLSRKFPTVLFVLRGDGEEFEDFWKEYYLDGKYQFCKGTITVSYEKFDPCKLTDEGAEE